MYNDSTIVIIPAIINIVLTLLTFGISIQVTKSTIEGSLDIPMIDFVDDIISGIKLMVTTIVYAIIPLVILILASIFLGIGDQLTQITSYVNQSTIQTMGVIDYNQLINLIPQDLATNFFMDLGILIIIGIILLIILGLILTIACNRLAETNSIRSSLDIRYVLCKIHSIGIMKYIAFYIIMLIFVIIFVMISGIVSMIPVVGGILAYTFVSSFLLLFQARARGLIYNEG
ncbi:MAG: DUF4013 domain-containing protein [Methanosphaera sp.]|nr:DUF4013 domain-containing protein [Methanosphaera sp.]